MNQDRELLEMAAKAAGLNAWWGNGFQSDRLFVKPEKPDTNGLITGIEWNPLTDDGDALRLAVALRLSHLWQHDWLMVYRGDDSVRERDLSDPCAAIRRAIVRAAAEIGRSMP